MFLFSLICLLCTSVIYHTISDFLLIYFTPYKTLRHTKKYIQCRRSQEADTCPKGRKVRTSSERRRANGSGSSIYLKRGLRKVPQRQYSAVARYRLQVKSSPKRSEKLYNLISIQESESSEYVKLATCNLQPLKGEKSSGVIILIIGLVPT